jgi:hypothetical protein
VLDLREGRGWSYHQIAEHLDVPVTTVEALLHRARKALRREFLAVSSGSRLAGMPIVGWLVLRLAGLRARVSGRTASQLAPVAGSAAAGLAAVGLVLTPFGAAAPPPELARPPAAVASHSAAPVAHNAPTESAAAPSDASTPASASRSRTSDTPPPATAEAGPVHVYSGPAGTEYAQSENAQQPLQLDLGPMQAGVNPEQTVADAVAHIPGGIP